MRDAAAQLMTRKRLGLDVFARGMPEPIRIFRTNQYDANVYDLLKAYSQQRQRNAQQSWKLPPRMHLVAARAQEQRERIGRIAVVVGDQDASHAFSRPSTCSAACGMFRPSHSSVA
jgi:segregation and condensation protein A